MAASLRSSHIRPPPPLFDVQPSRQRHQTLSVAVDSETGPSPRRMHIRRLYDVLHLCLQRGDMTRARRAWTILFQCAEFDGKEVWDLGELLVCCSSTDTAADKSHERKRYLKELQSLHRKDSPAILLEYVLHLLADQQFEDALNELELYLPIRPYALDPMLHEYAGICALLSTQVQARRASSDTWTESDVEIFGEGDESIHGTAVGGGGSRESSGAAYPARSGDISLIEVLRPLAGRAQFVKARQHFEHAKTLDAGSPVAARYLPLLESAARDS